MCACVCVSEHSMWKSRVPKIFCRISDGSRGRREIVGCPKSHSEQLSCYVSYTEDLQIITSFEQIILKTKHLKAVGVEQALYCCSILSTTEWPVPTWCPTCRSNSINMHWKNEGREIKAQHPFGWRLMIQAGLQNKKKIRYVVLEKDRR